MISDHVRRLVALGVDPGEAAAIVTEVFELGVSAGNPAEKRMQRIREYDRERKRNAKLSSGIPAVSTVSTERVLKGVSKKETNLSTATRIPVEWVLSESDRSWAQQQGLSDSEIDREVPRFKDWWGSKSGKDATKTDWSATWRNWVRNFLERNGRQRDQPGSPGLTTAERIAEYHRRYNTGGSTNAKDYEARPSNGHGDQSAGDKSELFPEGRTFHPDEHAKRR